MNIDALLVISIILVSVSGQNMVPVVDPLSTSYTPIARGDTGKPQTSRSVWPGPANKVKNLSRPYNISI